MNIVCISNPVSGRRHADERLEEVRLRLEARGVAFHWVKTQRAGHAAELAAGAVDADAILVAGGDGTLCDVINGLAGRRTPLAVLATGTENILAKEFRCASDPDGVVRTLLRGTATDLDVGLANGRRFLIVAGVGFDAEVVRRLVERRQGHISHVSYAGPLWDAFVHHRFPQLLVEVDGRAVFEAPGFAFVGNLPRYSMGMRILGRASFCDGRLDVCAFPCRSRTKLLQHAADILWRRHLDREGIVYASGRTIRITSADAAPVETDGEYFGTLPVTCGVSTREACILIDPEVRLNDGEIAG
ncbi:MAG: NAD(+)/NADH kinase [Phycisphaerales bacterium]|nr:NAD(+)/NADH kinase [Phycisphaerales bacterium]